MTGRLTFLAIAAFWLTMNGLLWRSEFGTQGNDTMVPVSLVWQKILTAPDASSLNVYRQGERLGYCEFATRLGQELATIEADDPPPESLAQRAGYEIQISGNVACGDFTNRLKFNGQVIFSTVRQWRELNLKIIFHQTVFEVHSLATNQVIHLKIASDGVILKRDLNMADLQNPNALMRALAGESATPLLGMELPDLGTTPASLHTAWIAHRTRVKIGAEEVPIYRLETRVLGHPITVDVSTLGEVLRVQLPGNVSAVIDGWAQP